MTVIIWIVEGTWQACVDAARAHPVPEGGDIVLLHVTGDDIPGVAHAAYAGLLGRGRPARDPGSRVEETAAAAAHDLLEAAAERLGRPAATLARHGRVEQEVVAAAEGADLLVMARDGDLSRLGPHSLGRAGRFVVDHAPCPVLLLWPETTPTISTIPPPPPHPHPHPHPHP